MVRPKSQALIGKYCALKDYPFTGNMTNGQSNPKSKGESMKKAHILLIALTLSALFTACNLTEPQPPEVSINTELFFLIGQPLRYFKDNFDLEPLELKGEESHGAPVQKYVIDGNIYVFNNIAGYAELTDDTLCTQILVKYTELLPGVKDGELTDELLSNLFGECTDINGGRRQYSSSYTYIYFSIDENGNYGDLAELNINWGFRFKLSSFITSRENPEIEISPNTELFSLLGKPLSYFKEIFDFENAVRESFRDYEWGESSYYTFDGITYYFDNSNDEDVVTDETPCTTIYADYTDVLLNIQRGKLTEEIVRELFGEGKWVIDFTYEHHFDNYHLYFMIDNHGNYVYPVILGIDREYWHG